MIYNKSLVVRKRWLKVRAYGRTFAPDAEHSLRNPGYELKTTKPHSNVIFSQSFSKISQPIRFKVFLAISLEYSSSFLPIKQGKCPF